MGECTRIKRRALIEGNEEVIIEALSQLDSREVLPLRAWWRLEGVTYVDCALLTPSAVVFIEGKRTELGPSRGILWYPWRNQVLRNLDCAAALAESTNRSHYYVLLVVDEELVEADPERELAVLDVVAPDTVGKSLPHLSNEARSELMKHYLGATTWQAIIRRFDLDEGLLLDNDRCR